MRQIVFTSRSEKDFLNWGKTDEKTYLKILELISDIDRTPFAGIGKPEPLKHELAGFWSRRINKKDRLVYKISSHNEIVIAGCKGHYS